MDKVTRQLVSTNHNLFEEKGEPTPAQMLHVYILRASLSGTFLQTLTELVTPLKAGALFYRRAAVHRRGQRVPRGLATIKTVDAT